MMTTKIIFAAALMLGLSGGVALAQTNDAEANFYADPVLPDPVAVSAPAYPPSEATADVAAVAPAAEMHAAAVKPARTPHAATCTALNPCAMTTPAARG